MFRSIITAALRRKVTAASLVNPLVCNQRPIILSRFISSIQPSKTFFPTNIRVTSLVGNEFLKPQISQFTQERTVTKFSLNKGKRKTVKAVIKRFKRLDWGCWIRTHSGRHKKLFKKSPALKRRLKQHVLVNAAQSTLLDKMVTNFWRKPKHYIDDPYKPYMKREEYWATKSKPIGY